VPAASLYPDLPEGSPPVHAVPDAEAADEQAMKPYREVVPGTDAAFDLVPIPGGEFLLGSPADEAGRKSSEGPQVSVKVSPFWMGRCEVTWDEYEIYQMRTDQELRKRGALETLPCDSWADAVSRPTPPYVPMDFNMGTEGFPAVCMTQFAARQYCKWLSMKTGRFYRLPTEAEWEYACRAGTTGRYSFGDDVAELENHAWFRDNSRNAYQKVGTKEPNPWGLHDMHGNVAEWVHDAYDKGHYATLEAGLVDPLHWPEKLFPRVVRGGSWDDDAKRLRSAARRASNIGWQIQDPQMPKSIWYHTDASFVGFRVVRPLAEPDLEERLRYWEADLESIREIQERQRRGGR